MLLVLWLQNIHDFYVDIPDIMHQLLLGQRAGRAVRTLACQLRDTLTLDDTMTRMTTRVQYWPVLVLVGPAGSLNIGSVYCVR